MKSSLDLARKVLPLLLNTQSMLMPFYGNITEIGQKDNRAVSAVTELDLKVERYLKTELRSAYPDIEFVGEENGGSREAERFWLCDPIDGTGHFIRGMPFCTVMLALIENGRVIFGAVYDFVHDIVYHAELGEGAFANHRPIHVSERGLQQGYVIWESKMDKDLNQRLRGVLAERTSTLETLCAGWGLAMVACGRVEARITYDGYGVDYDFAPGSLLVKEAGGIVANIGKMSYDYRNYDFIAANPFTFKDLTVGRDAVFMLNE